MHAPRALIVAAALLVLGASSASVMAHAERHEVSADGSAVELSTVHLRAYAGVSMDQAVKMVEQRFRARVVRAESQHEGGRTVYVLKLLNDSGQVWTVRVDAESGAIL